MPLTLDRLAPSLLDRGIISRTPDLPTQTDPVLEEIPGRFAVSGPAQDSVIAVIENPAASSGRYFGLLFGEHFFDRGGGVRYFQAVHYFRVDYVDSVVAEAGEFHRVHVRKGADLIQRSQTFEFLETTGGGVLPHPSLMPYEVVPVPATAYERFKSVFADGKAFPDEVGYLSILLEHRVKSFSYDTETKRLLLPANYASLSGIPLHRQRPV